MKDLRRTVTIQTCDFNLDATLDSGQVFGFRKSEDGAWRGRVYGREVAMRQTKTTLTAEGTDAVALAAFFDLERDLTPVYRILREDPLLRPAFRAYRGLRLIRQDSWEALACFILSSNNNVKRIQQIRNNLAARLGEGGAFPTARQITRSHERTLREIGLGYRAPFLQRTALFVAANPQSLDCVREAGYEEAKSRVLAFPGIGEKVADCVLLYGFQKYESFPVDVWILRIVRKLYFKNRRVSEEKVRRFGQKKWGMHAGYVQQYLFHGVRKGVI
jgi:N-glycosylase/DNA lyase